MDEANHLKI